MKCCDLVFSEANSTCPYIVDKNWEMWKVIITNLKLLMAIEGENDSAFDSGICKCYILSYLGV